MISLNMNEVRIESFTNFNTVLHLLISIIVSVGNHS